MKPCPNHRPRLHVPINYRSHATLSPTKWSSPRRSTISLSAYYSSYNLRAIKIVIILYTGTADDDANHSISSTEQNDNVRTSPTALPQCDLGNGNTMKRVTWRTETWDLGQLMHSTILIIQEKVWVTDLEASLTDRPRSNAGDTLEICVHWKQL